MRRTTCLMACVLGWCGVAGAAAPHVPRVDFLGDPLPPGAVARFGSLRMRLPPYGLRGMAFSKDGKELITASNGKLQFWDTRTGKLLRQVGLEDGWATLPISKDGKRMLGGVRGGDMGVYEVATGRAVRTFAPPKGSSAISLSPDGCLAATGDESGIIRLYSVDKQEQPPKLLKGHQYGVQHLAFSPNSRYLASADWADDVRIKNANEIDHVVRVWDVKSGKQVREFSGHVGGVGGLVWTPDSKSLVVQWWRPRVWNVDTGKEEPQIGERERTYDTTVAVSPDGKVFAMRPRSDDVVELWDRTRNRRLLSMRGVNSNCQAFSPDGKTLAHRAPDGKSIWLRDVKTGEVLPVPPGPKEEFTTFDLSPDGKTLATAGDDSVIRLWDFATGKLRREVKGHYGVIGDLRFSLCGEYLVSTSRGRGYQFPRKGGEGDDDTVRLWRVSDGKQLRRYENHGFGLAFFPDGKTFALGRVLPGKGVEADQDVCLYRLPSGEGKKFATKESLATGFLLVCPDGRWLVTATYSQDNWGHYETGLKVIDVKTGELVGTIGGKGRRLSAIGFTPDGRWLVCVEGVTVRLWDVNTRKEVVSLSLTRSLPLRHGRLALAGGLRLSPDGQFLTDFHPSLWEMATGQRVLAFPVRWPRFLVRVV